MSGKGMDAIGIDAPRKGIARITLQLDDQMNTLTWPLMDGIEAATRTLAADPPRALIVRGRGKAFCGGAPLRYFHGADAPLVDNPTGIRDIFVRRVLDVFGGLQQLACPTIAAINGHALGGGMELALACDFRLMSTSARIGQSEVRLGVAAGGNGIQQLHRIVGRAKALEILLTGESLTAEMALACGLVTSIHPPEALDDAAIAYAERFFACSPQAVGVTKRAVYRTENADRDEANEIALDAVFETFSSAEAREGLSAFVEKRRPDYVWDKQE